VGWRGGGGGLIIMSINVCCNLKVKLGEREREREGYMENIAICVNI